MKFIVDTQLPPRLAKYLTDKGYDATHTMDTPEGHLLPDAEIVIIATQQNRIIVTKDADFVNHYYLKGAPPRVLLLGFGNISNRDLLAQLEKQFKAVARLFGNGAELIFLADDGITLG